MIKYRCLQFIIPLLLVSVGLRAQETERLTLAECREMALENNKQMRVALAGKEKAAFDSKSYRALFLPKFSLSGLGYFTGSDVKTKIPGGYLPTFVPDPATGQLLPNLLGEVNGNQIFKQYAYMPDVDIKLKLSETYLAGVSLEQPIYMGGKIRRAYRMARIGEEVAGWNVALTRSEILVKTDEAYWMHICAQELQKSAGKYREVIQELYRNVKDAYDVGLKSQNDVLKVQVKLNEAELQLRKSENAVRLSRMNLCHMIGLPLYSEVMLEDSLEETTLAVERTMDISSRPEYQMLEQQIGLKSEQVKLVRSDFLPQLSMGGNFNYMYGLKLNNEPLLDNASFSALVSLKIPLFQWGEGRNKIRSAQTEQQIAVAQRDDVAEQMTLELAQALNNYDEALLEVTLTANALAQAEENLKVSRDHYDVGLETLVNYMEAQTLWQKIWADAIHARAAQKVSESAYLKAAGKL